MSAIKYALNQLRFRIPAELLRVAFANELPHWRQAPVSLDELITTKVIRGRVFDDIDTVGGEHVLIPLLGLATNRVDVNTIIYEIPPERINYRTIMSVLSVHYYMYSLGQMSGPMGNGFYTGQYSNDLLSVGNRIMEAAGTIPPTSSATCEMIAHNTILVRDLNRVVSTYMIRCVLGNDENLANLNPRSYGKFADLIELAVKSYIYNHMVVKIDNAFLTGGQELGSIKQLVEGYADAEEMYQTYLREKWTKVAFMNDKGRHRRFISVQINPAI